MLAGFPHLRPAAGRRPVCAGSPLQIELSGEEGAVCVMSDSCRRAKRLRETPAGRPAAAALLDPAQPAPMRSPRAVTLPRQGHWPQAGMILAGVFVL